MRDSVNSPQSANFVPTELLIRRDGITLLQPKIFSQRPELVSAVSTRQNSNRPSAFGMNISYKVGDDPSFVRNNRETFFSVLMIGEQNIAPPSQVHGDTIALVDRPEGASDRSRPV